MKENRERGFFVNFGYTKDAEDECRGSFARLSLTLS